MINANFKHNRDRYLLWQDSPWPECLNVVLLVVIFSYIWFDWSPDFVKQTTIWNWYLENYRFTKHETIYMCRMFSLSTLIFHHGYIFNSVCFCVCVYSSQRIAVKNSPYFNYSELNISIVTSGSDFLFCSPEVGEC